MASVEIDLKQLKKAIHGQRDAIASHLSIHPNSLSRKISGKHELTLDELNQITKFLNCDTTDFLTIRDSKEKWKIVRVDT